MTASLAAALAVVRGWTRVYTARMDPPIRDARRAEIESDLWELHEDARRRGASPTRIAIQMVLRLLFGIADDLAWRAEHVRVSTRIVQEALWAAAAASLIFLWWLATSLEAIAPHERPDGINVLRLLYPMRPIVSVPTPPEPPIEFTRLTRFSTGRSARALAARLCDRDAADARLKPSRYVDTENALARGCTLHPPPPPPPPAR